MAECPTSSSNDEAFVGGIGSIGVGGDEGAFLVTDIRGCTTEFHIVHVTIQTDDNRRDGRIHCSKGGHILHIVVLHTTTLNSNLLQLVVNTLLSNYVRSTAVGMGLEVLSSDIGGTTSQ